MSEEKTNVQDQTTVDQVDIDLEDIFSGAPGMDSVAGPTEEETKKPNVFSNGSDVDMSFLDEDIKDEEETSDDDESKEEETKSEESSKEDLDDLLNPDDESEEEEKPKRGRKRIEGVSDVFSKLIDDEMLIPFDDDKPIEEYSAKDFQELLEANFQERERQIREQTPQQFFESLPEELQYAAKYVMDGGQDLKGLFGALAATEEVRSLNPETESGQEEIARQFMLASGLVTPEEVDEEIENLKDLGKLEQYALRSKPKLDKMQEKVMQQRLAEQEEMKARQEAAANAYMENVYNALKPGELNGVKLDRRTQAELYEGLVQPNYDSYVSGKKVNELAHLLEKYQFVEPNYGLISEALWLLKDPEGYKSKIQSVGEKRAVEKTVRQLKTEQNSRVSSTSAQEEEPRQRRGIPRPGNIFKR
jgi:hypothetical protein